MTDPPEVRFIVVLSDLRWAWGPFATRSGAGEFADFVTREIDPAEVRALSSPVGELIAWRKKMLEPGRD